MNNIKKYKIKICLISIVFIYMSAILCNSPFVMSIIKVEPTFIKVASVVYESIGKLHDSNPTPIEFEDGTNEIPEDLSYDGYQANCYKCRN